MSGRYETFAKQHLNVINVTGAELMARCLFHDDSSASMQFNVDKGLFICFGCGAKGTVKKLERELGLKIVEDQIDIAHIREKLRTIRKGKLSKELAVLEESYLLNYRFPTRYWKNRGFTEDTIKAFDLGCDPFGEFVTIPIRNVHGELLGVIKRFLNDNELKYKYPKGFKRQLNIFGSWLIEEDEEAHTVVLTEGSLDAAKVWQAGIPAGAVYGSSISATQIRLLRRLGVRKIVLFFDNDKAGRKAVLGALGVKIHQSRSKRGPTYESWEYEPLIDLTRDFIVEAVQYSDDVPDDPGAMTEKQIKRMVSNAKPISLATVRKDLPKIKRRRYSR